MDPGAAGVWITAIAGLAATVVTAMIKYGPRPSRGEDMSDVAQQLRNVYVRLGALETQGAISANNYEHLCKEVTNVTESVDRLQREVRENRRRLDEPG